MRRLRGSRPAHIGRPATRPLARMLGWGGAPMCARLRGLSGPFDLSRYDIRVPPGRPRGSQTELSTCSWADCESWRRLL